MMALDINQTQFEWSYSTIIALDINQAQFEC